MALQNSKTVALERRYDWSTLFCMLGRHGPAVVMAIVATLSMLVAFVIYRIVRGQRRKVTAAADTSILGAEKDAAVGPPGPLPNPEESHNPVESTVESDGESPVPHGETEEYAHLIQGQNLETSECCAAAAAAAAVDVDVPYAAVEEEPRLSSPPAPWFLWRLMSWGLMSRSNDLACHHTPEDDVEETAAASQCHQSESNTVSESAKPKINAENAGEFTQCDLDTSQEETAKDEASQYETAKDDTIQDENVQDDTAKEETTKNETVPDETVQEETVQEETAKKEAAQYETAKEEIAIDETTKNETVQDETVQEETVRDETVREETVQDETVQEETVRDETVREETVQDETVQEETAEKEAAQYETAKEETAMDETTKNETVQDETKDETVQDETKNETVQDETKDETVQDETKNETVHDETAKDEGVTDAEESKQREEELHDCESGQEEDLEMACKAEDEEEITAVCQDEDTPTAVCQDEDTPTDERVLYENTKREEEDVQSATNEPLACTPPVDNDDGLRHEKTAEDEETFQSAALETPSPVPQAKDDSNEEENEEGDWHREYIDNGNYDQEKHVEYPIIPQHAEVCTPLPDQSMSLPLTELPSFYEQQLDEEQNECEHMAESVTLPPRDGDQVDRDGAEASHIVDGDLHSETVQVSDPQGATTCEPQLQNEATNNEESFPPGVADQLKEKSVTCDGNHCTATDEICEDGDLSSLVHTGEPENEKNDDKGKCCVPAIVIHEDWDLPNVMPSSYQQPQGEQEEDNDLDDVTIPVTDEENGLPVHGPHLPSLSQEEPSGKKDVNEGVDGDNATVLDEDDKLPTHLSSFGQEPQSQKQVDNNDSNVSSPTVDEDSGISSKTFSLHLQSAPQSQDVDDDEDVSAPITDEDWDLALDPHLPSVDQQQQCCPDAIDMSVTNSDHPSMAFGSLPSPCYQPHSYQLDEVTEQLGANDDMSGQAVEDRYYSEFDELGKRIAASITSCADELNNRTDTTDTAKLLELKKKQEGGSIDEKGRTQQAKEDEEEEHQKTEINIMEATMDNNEWMTDGNSQVLPWMSFSLKSYAQNLTKADQLPTEDPQHCSTSTAATTDADSSNEAKDATTFSLLDDDAENNKKVAAVQPMPQNVNVTFCVHYLAHSPGQTVAVTGNQQELGNWKDFIPLERAKDGFWASVINLPTESQVEWKFVLVDEGKIRRWEECENRCLDTGHGDDVHMHKWWGLL